MTLPRLPAHLVGGGWRHTYAALARAGKLDLHDVSTLQRTDLGRYGLHDSDWPIVASAKMWRDLGLTVPELRLVVALLRTQSPAGWFPRTLGDAQPETGATYRVTSYLLSLRPNSELDREIIRRACDYLLRTQMDDGGFPPFEGAESDVGTTARIALTLAEAASLCPERESDWKRAAQRAGEFLLSSAESRDDLMSWRYVPAHGNSQPTSVASTALAVRALARLSHQFDRRPAAMWLVSQHVRDGGWEATRSRPFTAGPTFWACRTLIELAPMDATGAAAAVVRETLGALRPYATQGRVPLGDRVYILRTLALDANWSDGWRSVAKLQNAGALAPSGRMQIYREAANTLLLHRDLRRLHGSPYADPHAAPLRRLGHTPLAGTYSTWGVREVLFEHMHWPWLWLALARIGSIISLEQVVAVGAAFALVFGAIENNPLTRIAARYPEVVPGLTLTMIVLSVLWVSWKILSRRSGWPATSALSYGGTAGLVAVMWAGKGEVGVLVAVGMGLYVDVVSSLIDLLDVFRKSGRSGGGA